MMKNGPKKSEGGEQHSVHSVTFKGERATEKKTVY